MTSEQLRAARAMLRMDQAQLAAEAGVSVETVKRLEKIDGNLDAVRVATIKALKSSLEARGVIFLDDGQDASGGPGVRLRSA